MLPETNLSSTSVPQVLVLEPRLSTEVRESSLDALFAACMPKLARTARRLPRNTADSGDLVQDSLLSAFKNLHQFEGRSEFSTWLHSIVRNKATMHLRKASAHPWRSIDEEASENGEWILECNSGLSLEAEERC